MTIVKFNPFSNLFSSGIVPFIDKEEDWPKFQITEGLDIYETENDVVVKAIVPGVPANKVKVTFEDGILRILAKNEENQEENEKKKVVYQHQRMVCFDYTTTLPRPVVGNKISAEVKNGMIIVKAPIVQESKTKRVPVKDSSK